MWAGGFASHAGDRASAGDGTAAAILKLAPSVWQARSKDTAMPINFAFALDRLIQAPHEQTLIVATLQATRNIHANLDITGGALTDGSPPPRPRPV